MNGQKEMKEIIKGQNQEDIDTNATQIITYI